MKLPLNVCQAYGQFAFQDEQKGIDAIAMIQDYLEEYRDTNVRNNDSQGKIVRTERDQSGSIVKAKSTKLSNIIINLKTLFKEKQELLEKSIDVTVTVDGLLDSDSLLAKITAVLALVRFAINLVTIELKQEHARVLTILHYLSAGEWKLTIPLSELQIRVGQDYHLAMTLEQLDEILKDLTKFRCIGRQGNNIYLTEKIVISS